MFRRTGVSLRNSIFEDTFKKVLRSFYDGKLFNEVQFIKDDMEVHFPNGSKILFAGLDNPERIERLFGMEYATIWVNEISEIKEYTPIISTLIFRLRAPVNKADGTPATHKFYMDCNPPDIGHWADYAFIRKVNPSTGKPHARPDNWRELAMNTIDNPHLPPGYIDELKEGLSEREVRRLIYGEWLNNNESALFPSEVISNNRVHLPDDPKEADLARKSLRAKMVRCGMAVDPAMSGKKKSDLNGIVVAGVDTDGHAYVFEDASIKGAPQTMADRARKAAVEWDVDFVLYESNNGGDHIGMTLRSAGLGDLPLRPAWAGQSKALRAEPLSGPYEKGRVHHVGRFAELEAQMERLTLDADPRKNGSPDRLDALVWVLRELLLIEQRKPSKVIQSTVGGMFG